MQFCLKAKQRINEYTIDAEDSEVKTTGGGEGNLKSMAEKMRENREAGRVYVFHLKPSSPHFFKIGATFDSETRSALKEHEMLFSPTSAHVLS